MKCPRCGMPMRKTPYGPLCEPCNGGWGADIIWPKKADDPQGTEGS